MTITITLCSRNSNRIWLALRLFCFNDDSFLQNTFFLKYFIPADKQMDMLRNSFLMQKDYKIHADVVRLIYQPEWDDLWDLSPEKLSQEYYADRIMKLSESITEAYVASGVGIPTDTLLTKILLGTGGGVPAYDRYFKKALADTGAAPQAFSVKSIRTLGNLYLDHEDEFEKLRKHCGSRIEYPAAKILDMCFFEYGFQRDASSQEDSD